MDAIFFLVYILYSTLVFHFIFSKGQNVICLLTSTYLFWGAFLF